MSGGGDSGDQVTEWRPSAQTAPYWEEYLKKAQTLTAEPLTPYGGQTVANWTPSHQAGLEMLNAVGTSGTPLGNASGVQLEQTALGGFVNPYATTNNPYMGDNPYLDTAISNSNDAIAKSFARGTAAQTDSMAARSGNYGGSSWKEQQGMNQENLLSSLANNTNQLRMNNYNQSAGLAENALNRATGAFEGERGRQIQAASQAPAMQNMNLDAIKAMIGGGDMSRQYQNELLTAGKNYFTQTQQSPFAALDAWKSYLAPASGMFSQSVTSGGGGGNSNLGLALGAGLLGMGALS